MTYFKKRTIVRDDRGNYFAVLEHKKNSTKVRIESVATKEVFLVENQFVLIVPGLRPR